MDFDELRRLQRGIAGAMDDFDPVGRRMREMDSVIRRSQEMYRAVDAAGEMSRAVRDLQGLDIAKGLREADSVARSLREADNVARSMREMTAASSLPDSVLGLRAMDPRVTGLDLHEMERLTGGSSLREMNLVTGGLYDQARRYIELEDSIQRQLRERLHDFEKAGATAVIRELATQAANEDWRRTVAEVGEQLSSAFALARGSDFEELNRRAEMLNDLTAGSAVFGMLARELARSASAGALTPALAGGFGGELLGYIEGSQAADSEKAIADFLKAFLVWLLSLAQRLPGTKLSNDAILSIFLTVAQLLYGQYSSDQMEQRLRGEIRESREEARHDHEETLEVVRENHEEDLKEMREMEARLTERIMQAQGNGDDAKALVVIRAAKLRSGPGKEFEALQVLPPNVQVEELGREGEWMHIEYFDYAEGELRSGWISVELLVEKRDSD